MLRIVIKKILIALSIIVFLVTSAWNTFGYAWCIGDDGHAQVEQVFANGCTDRPVECHYVESYGPESLFEEDTGRSRSCYDVVIGEDEVKSGKVKVKDLSTGQEEEKPISEL